MKTQILSHLDNPDQLEALYRSDKTAFREAFQELRPSLEDNLLLRAWDSRLHFERKLPSNISKTEIRWTVLLAFLAGIYAKLPSLFDWDEETFYTRNAFFIVMPALAAFFARRQKIGIQLSVMLAVLTLGAGAFINTLPASSDDLINLSLLHVPIILWGLVGVAYVGTYKNRGAGRLHFLQYNGDLIVIGTLLGIGGMILTGMTIGLFELIGIDIVEFYFENVVVFGLPAIPIFGSFLVMNNPKLVEKIVPMIARIFSPIVLVMLVVYLIAMLSAGEDPYHDREFLLIFNLLLIGVMALIFFSLAEGALAANSKAENWILFLLALVTIVVNFIALSAIIYRIAAWGITPNRAAVMGSNVLILLHLLLVTFQLFKALTRKEQVAAPGKVLASYLPVYVIWASVVTFLFPLVF